MRVKCIASSHVGYKLPKIEALKFGGHAAGICYMPGSFGNIMMEETDKTYKRINQTLSCGHHSVYEHEVYSFYLEGIPKILAMILNNENLYATSEKSARYTKMEASGEETFLYNKWKDIFESVICKKYPQLSKLKLKKLAMENARYLISVFTPATNMLYTTSLRQWNYLYHWMDNFIREEEDNDFIVSVKEVLLDFMDKIKMQNILVKDLSIEPRTKGISLFNHNKIHEDYFGQIYQTTYTASYVYLAQAQRHRTIHYSMANFEKPTMFFVPPIIKGTILEKGWLMDMYKLSNYYPQGILIKVTERGTYENFILKCEERLCGQAQLEIMLKTNEILNNYLKNTKDSDHQVYESLLRLSNGSRCNIPGYVCKEPCMWGKDAMKRLV